MVGCADFHDAPVDQLLRWWDGADPPPAGFEGEFLDEVAYGLSRHRPEGVAVLKSALHTGDGVRRAAALEFLAVPGLADDEIRTALAEAIAGEDRDLRYRALWGFIRLGYHPLDEEQVRDLMEGEDHRMAALAMVYLSRARPADTMTILGAALGSPNPRMREYACDEVGDRGIAELAGRLTPLLADPDADVAAAARSNLEFFDGGVVGPGH